MISNFELDNLFDRVARLEYQNHNYQSLFNRIATLEHIDMGPRLEALETLKTHNLKVIEELETNHLKPQKTKTETNRIDIESLQRSITAIYRLVLLDNERYETWKQNFDADIAKLRHEVKEVRVNRNVWKQLRRDHLCAAED